MNIVKYSTWDKFVNAVTKQKVRKGWGRKFEASTDDDTYGYDYYNTNSYEEAVNYLTEGWQEGIDSIRKYQKQIPTDIFDCVVPVSDYKPELHYQIAGGVVDVAAHIAGASPEVFIAEHTPIDSGEKQRGSKLQTIYMQIFNSRFTEREAFFYRGAYTFLLTEHLEQCGYSVEAWLVLHAQGNNHQHKIYVCVKQFGELFDANKLVIAFSSAFMLRRFFWRLTELLPDEMRQDAGNYYYHPIINSSIKDVALPEDSGLKPIYINNVNESDPTTMLAKFRTILAEWAGTEVIQA